MKICNPDAKHYDLFFFDGEFEWNQIQAKLCQKFREMKTSSFEVFENENMFRQITSYDISSVKSHHQSDLT